MYQKDQLEENNEKLISLTIIQKNVIIKINFKRNVQDLWVNLQNFNEDCILSSI